MKYALIIALLFSFNSHAGLFRGKPSRIVAKQVEKKLYLVQNAFQRGEFSSVLRRRQDQEAYYLKRIRLQYAPFVAFDVAFFEVKIMPLIEFRWTRQNPKGWVNYRREI